MELPDDSDNVVYVSHKLVRQPKYKGKWKEKFLKFYLVDQSGREQLAATAEDTGDAHYIYTSSENFKNYGVVSCRNREELILWLEMVIKKSQMKAAGQKALGESENCTDFAGFQFVGHRLEKLILEDGRRCNRWYLVDSESNEHLAVVGKERCASDGHYDYKAEEPFASRYPLRCSNLQGVLRWVAHMITPQTGHHASMSVPTTRGTPLATNSGGSTPGDYTPSSKSPARCFALQASANPSKRRKLTSAVANSQGTSTAEEMLVARPRWAASTTVISTPGQLDVSFSMPTGEAQQEWDGAQQQQHPQHVKLARARQSSLGASAQVGPHARDPIAAQKDRQADHEDMLIADALVDLQQDPSQAGVMTQQAQLKAARSGGVDRIGHMVSTLEMEGTTDPTGGKVAEENEELYTDVNQKLIFDAQLQCQWSMRARNAIVTKGKVLARMKAGIYVYDSEQQELVRLEDTAYNRMKARIKESFGKVFPNLAVEQNISDPCHPAFKVTPVGTVSVGLFARDHLGPGTILGDYLYRAVLETYAENEHYVMMDPTGKRALQEMYSMDLAFTSSWEGDALVALGHPARNTLACMNDYRALPQGSNKPHRRTCSNPACNCHSYTRRTPNVELLETIEITPQRTIIPHLLVLTKRRVAHGDEILWDFGADFWERYEALVRRVHYVESQSQELERMKQTVEMSQHQLTALQNYIYEREQVISKLQQVMAMHGLNAEQALQMQLPYQPVLQDADGRLISIDASEAAGVMSLVGTTSQALSPSLPPAGEMAANNTPAQPTDSQQAACQEVQNIAYTDQLQNGLVDTEVASLTISSTDQQIDCGGDQKHAEPLELLQSHMNQVGLTGVMLGQMQPAASHLPAGTLQVQPGPLPLTLEQLQAAQQQLSGNHISAEQLAIAAGVQYLPVQALPAGDDLRQSQRNAALGKQAASEQLQSVAPATGHVQKLHLGGTGAGSRSAHHHIPVHEQQPQPDVQQMQVLPAHVMVSHNMPIPDQDDSDGMKQQNIVQATAVQLLPEQMQLMTNQMQQLGHVAPDQEVSNDWMHYRCNEAREHWPLNVAVKDTQEALNGLQNPNNEGALKDAMQSEMAYVHVQPRTTVLGADQSAPHSSPSGTNTMLAAAVQLPHGSADKQQAERPEQVADMGSSDMPTGGGAHAAELHAQVQLFAAGHSTTWSFEQVHTPIPAQGELPCQSSTQTSPAILPSESFPEPGQAQPASRLDTSGSLSLDPTDSVTKGPVAQQHDTVLVPYESTVQHSTDQLPLVYEDPEMVTLRDQPEAIQPVEAPLPATIGPHLADHARELPHKNAISQVNAQVDLLHGLAGTHLEGGRAQTALAACLPHGSSVQ